MATIYKNFVLLDGTERMHPANGLVLVVIGGRIVKICSESDLTIKGVSAIDLGGRYLMPGLINLHAHISEDGIPKKNAGEAGKPDGSKAKVFGKIVDKIKFKKNALSEMLSGSTTISTTSNGLFGDVELRDEINGGKKEGPRILASCEPISFRGGVINGINTVCARTAKEMEDIVNEHARRGADCINLNFFDIAEECGPGFDDGVLKELIMSASETTHRNGMKVILHGVNVEFLKKALESGVDVLGHIGRVDDDCLQMMRIRKTALVSSLSTIVPLAEMDNEFLGISREKQEKIALLLNEIISTTKKAFEYGIMIGIGSDAGMLYSTHYGMWRELEYFKRYYNVSPEFAIYTATLRNAEIAGVDQETGSIEEGKSADFIVTNANPLDSFAALSQPHMVVMRGNAYFNPKVRKNKELESRLNKLLS